MATIDMASMRVYMVTFNCARTLIDVDHFAAHFFHGQPKDAPLPHLVVLSLQEVAPVAHSFLGGFLLVPYLSRFVQAINKAANPLGVYRHVVTRNIGMTAIMVMALSNVTHLIQPTAFAGVGVGHAEMGNKGAVGVRLAVSSSPAADPLPFTFVAAHLAPMEDACERRNKDWKDIVQGLAFVPPKTKATAGTRAHDGTSLETEPLLAHVDQQAEPAGIFDGHGFVIFAGDLNYRTSDQGPSPTEYHLFPQPKDFVVDEQGHASAQGIAAERKSRDQLSREKKAGRTLHSLEELPISFPPTYKYADNAWLEWPTDGAEPKVWRWSKHRFPSWCDRILFSKTLNAAPTRSFAARSYRALPLLPTSDHRPVALLFDLDLKELGSQHDQLESPFPLNPQWLERRNFARRLEIVVGGLAYLGTTWEGNALIAATLLGTVGGWYMIQSALAS